MTFEEQLRQCRWPDLRGMYRIALQEIVEYVLGRYPNVVGLVAAGTIVRGNPDPASDFDIYVIHTGAFRQRIQRRFSGVPAEIFVNPPRTVEGYLAEESASGSPITAHMLATGFRILALDPVVEELCEKAKERLDHPPARFGDPTEASYFIASAFEDGVDVLGRDEAAARMLLSAAVEKALKRAFLARGRYLPRPKDLIRELDDLDRTLAEQARRFYAERSLPDAADAARRIVHAVTGETGFFEWESDPEPV